MPTVILRCRSTRMGAFTSAGGSVVNRSRSGYHWDEVVEGEIGHKFFVTDISNSGKHRCFEARIVGDGEYEVIAEAGRICQWHQKGD